MSPVRGPDNTSTGAILTSENDRVSEASSPPIPCVEIVPATPAAALDRLDRYADSAREFLGAAKAESTRRAYRTDWVDFTAWCREYGREPLPAAPETVALYLTARAGTHKASTLQRRLSSISQAHQAAGHESPTRHYVVRQVWAGIRRTLGTAQEGVAPATVDVVRRMVAVLSDSTLDVRNGSIMLILLAAALRRSELTALNFEDVTIRRDGLVIVLRRSKTDQEGAGVERGIPYGQQERTCAVRWLKRWLKVSGIEEGALFRSIDRHGNLGGRLSDRAIALIVKRLAEGAGLDPTHYSGHSGRAGFATSAGEAGVEEREIMRQTGHTSTKTVRKYIRAGAIFRNNAAGRIGL